MNPDSAVKPIEHLNDFFDCIYVLSLKHATQRQHHMQHNLTGVDFKFFWGVDKRNLDFSTTVENGIYCSDLHFKTKRTARDMNIGEIACALSHRAIYEDVLKRGFRRVLILEDDARPCAVEIGKLRSTLGGAPDDWDVIMLGYYSEKPDKLYYKIQRNIYMMCHRLGLFKWGKVSKSWIRGMCLESANPEYWQKGRVLGAHAYAITNSGARKLAGYHRPVHLQADRIFYQLAAEGHLNLYLTKTKLFTLSDLSKVSYIGYDRAHGLGELGLKYWRRLNQRCTHWRKSSACQPLIGHAKPKLGGFIGYRRNKKLR